MDCSRLLPAKARLAAIMKKAPVAAPLRGTEETWLIERPFRNQFPQGYGKSRRCHARPENGCGRRQASVGPVLFHPDYTVGCGIAPDLLTPRTVQSEGARGLGV